MPTSSSDLCQQARATGSLGLWQLIESSGLSVPPGPKSGRPSDGPEVRAGSVSIRPGSIMPIQGSSLVVTIKKVTLPQPRRSRARASL